MNKYEQRLMERERERNARKKEREVDTAMYHAGFFEECERAYDAAHGIKIEITYDNGYAIGRRGRNGVPLFKLRIDALHTRLKTWQAMEANLAAPEN